MTNLYLVTADHPGTTSVARPTRLRRRRRWALIGVITLIAVLLAAIAWIAIRGLLAKQELDGAVGAAADARAAIVAGDTDAAMAAAEELAGHAVSAADLTSDPVWRAVEAIPLVGPNLATVRVLAATVDEVASGAVLPLASAAGSVGLDAFRPADGRIDLAPIVALQAPAAEASAAVSSARDTLAEVDGADVLAPIADARTQLDDLLTETARAVDALDRASRLVPAMLGANGPRDILLLFQNNAELRTLGGSPAALALVHVDGGAFELTTQADSGDFPRFDPPAVELPLETRALWGDNAARWIHDVTFAPQFPIAATTAREMWRDRFGEEPASVVAFDPVALSYLLTATGPITLSTGDVLTSENAVPFLLQEVYARYPSDSPTDTAGQDALFAEVTRAVVAALRTGTAEPRALIDAMVRAGDERRLLIWNADASEQEILAGTTLTGDLPTSTDQTQAFGLYLNDMTGSKMDPYLDVQVAAAGMVCRNDGLPEYQFTVSLANTAPPDAATALPEYVTGGGANGTPAGAIRTSVHLYSEPGTYNLGVFRDGQPVPYHPTADAGYTLSRVEVVLQPGETAEWTFAFLGGEPGIRAIDLQHTPLVRTLPIAQGSTDCASSLN
ncbi:DUF4012 domain-containing protein [Agromyces sp. MMS24-JH15]|uniref:DUF4012 domain-containing protein n=1 Tax=Agromyces sp. MMS24-JH15 TaxID=3243765 RepID=UPI00374A4F1E